jgi:hypothetical protein
VRGGFEPKEREEQWVLAHSAEKGEGRMGVLLGTWPPATRRGKGGSRAACRGVEVAGVATVCDRRSRGRKRWDLKLNFK